MVTYDAVVSVQNDQLKLRPGMTANIAFIVSASDKALLVPSAALRFTPAGQTAAVEAKAGQRPAGKGRSAGADGARSARAGGKQAAGNKEAGDKEAGNKGAVRGAVGQGGRRVWVLGQDGKPAPVRVRTGISDGSYTEITSGQLKEGQQVITGVTSQKTGSSKAPAKSGGPGNRRRIL